jgi:hypothetical protein
MQYIEAWSVSIKTSEKLARDQDPASMGWVLLCCSEVMSNMVKAVKDHEATKTGLRWTVQHL